MVKKIAIVSLSSGILGEEFAKHEVEIGIKRLEEYGLEINMMPHAQSGIEYVKNHPQERAEDLLAAFADDSIDMIMTAIGGDDTYRLLPFLFDNDELKNEINDLLYHIMVLAANQGLEWSDVEQVLAERNEKIGNLKLFHQVDKNT